MRFLVILIICITIISCSKDNNVPIVNSEFQNGIFVLNEGNYTWSNSSVSFIDLDSGIVQNNLFLNINRKKLGDVAQSMYAIDTLLFIIVNNSSKIEVVSLNNFQLINTIQGFTSPRYMTKVNNELAFVSDLYSKYLKVINYQSFEIVDSIFLGKSSENLLKFNERIFVTNWSKLGMDDVENNTIQIIDINTFTLVDSVRVSYEPCGLQIDKENNLWVLCSGNFTNTDTPALYKIDPYSLEVLNRLEFSNNNSPKHLAINDLGDQLYYLNSDLYRISIFSDDLPIEPIIRAANTNFYNFDLSPFSENIYLTNALDYIQNGYVYQYNSFGTPLDTFEVRITPSEMLFINRN
jgi:DNA-binding beta-propeller fold protein YncE